MNVKPYKNRENSDFFKPINSNILNNIDINSQGKIQEKLITINAHNIPYPKENKIKELEITLKPNKINNIIISPKNDHQPYLKPKFNLKNRNSFFIKSKNKVKTEFMTNDGIKDLNLNLLRIYYDENGKNIKIIREKDINKEKEKEKNNKNDIKNNSNNKTSNKKNKINNINDSSSNKNTKSKKGTSKENKYFYPDTPSQSTTTENKSDTKSIKTRTKNGTTNSKRQSDDKNKNSINEKNKIFKGKVYYDNLPLFLKKKKQLKKIAKTYKDLYNINKKINNNGKKQSYEKTQNNKIQNINNKDVLIKKINFNNIEVKETQKKKFISHKNNLSLNMTFERENIKNILYKKNNNNNLKKLYISSVKTRNVPDLKKINNDNLNNFDNIRSCKNAQRNTIQFPESYLFNFYRERKKEFFRNKSFGNQNMNLTNNYSNNISRESSFYEQPQSNLSFTLFKNNAQNFMNENNESILNKTKNILKLNEAKKNYFTNNNSKKYIILNNYESNFDRYPKRVIQQSHKNFREKIINIPNISYFINSKSMKEAEKENLIENKLNKNKRPCSLYFNKNILGKEKCNVSLNDYYNNAVYRNNNLTINNININQNSLGINRHVAETCKNELDINNNINKLSKLNINLKKFIGFNPNNSTQNLCKENNNNIFKFNRNKTNIKHMHNTSMNIGNSFLSLNKVYN